MKNFATDGHKMPGRPVPFEQTADGLFEIIMRDRKVRAEARISAENGRTGLGEIFLAKGFAPMTKKLAMHAMA